MTIILTVFVLPLLIMAFVIHIGMLLYKTSYQMVRHLTTFIMEEDENFDAKPLYAAFTAVGYVSYIFGVLLGPVPIEVLPDLLFMSIALIRMFVVMHEVKHTDMDKDYKQALWRKTIDITSNVVIVAHVLSVVMTIF